MKWIYDTNSGPVITLEGDISKVTKIVEDQIPLLKEDGYTFKWRVAAPPWDFIIQIIDETDTVVHTCGLKRKEEKFSIA